MKILWNILGGAAGWALGGPVGAVIGVGVAELLSGSNMEAKQKAQQSYNRGGRRTSSYQQRRDNTQAGDFHISLLVLSAVVIKSDGVIDQRELDYVRARFVGMFGKDKANESFRIFKQIVEKDIDTRGVCEQIRRNMAHSGRLQLVHFLFGVANSDGKTDTSELDAILRISRYLGIRDIDFQSIRATYAPKNNLDAAYQILEIQSSASNEEVKKAYRKMVVKYHPDKLQHLGEDVIKAAEEKFLKVQEAYDSICKARGI